MARFTQLLWVCSGEEVAAIWRHMSTTDSVGINPVLKVIKIEGPENVELCDIIHKVLKKKCYLTVWSLRGMELERRFTLEIEFFGQPFLRIED